jgi:hypothetical protein
MLSTHATWLWRLVAAAALAGPCAAQGGGVTLITHGFDANVTAWVIPMADKLAQYHNFPGTNCAEYEISITRTGSTYYASQIFLNGVPPLTSDSGEIIIALDWSTLSSGSVPTTAIATQAVAALLSTTLIPALNGHPLAESPMHFIGHSRGGSVITEMARLLGAQGVWVDQMTTLDPDPVSLFGDPPMKNYANILFADNYWQDMGDGVFVPNGQSIPGAYNRQLTNLNGGYSSSHSNTHLWYHGTIDLTTPITVDSATITSTQRQTWWTAAEEAGTNAGILYSLIGGGDRFSELEPSGAGNGRIIDGYNKVWDLGAGVAANPATNRAALPFDNGAWPNLLRLDLATSNSITLGDPISLSFYYQFATSTAAVASVQFYLDPDVNPYNGNETAIYLTSFSGTGTNAVAHGAVNVTPNPLTMQPGLYSIFARITDGAGSRYLYAPEKVLLTSGREAPLLSNAEMQGGQFQFTVDGMPGQKVVVQASDDLAQWVPLATNTLSGTSFTFNDSDSGNHPGRFYRAVLIQ